LKSLACFDRLHDNILEFDLIKQVLYYLNCLACFACLHNNILEFDSEKQVLFELVKISTGMVTLMVG
jgi:hypothetical protein